MNRDEFIKYKALRDIVLTSDQCLEITGAEAANLNPILLAYVGDAIFSLVVRMELIGKNCPKIQILHNMGAKIVSAKMQALAMQELLPDLTEAESSIARRGRNAKTNVPKSASVAEYRASTSFEALLGYLFLLERYSRLQELIKRSCNIIMNEMRKDKICS